MSPSRSSRRATLLFPLAGFFVSVMASSPARAQAVGQKAGRAETLFQDGRALLEQGKIHEACLKFSASQKEDPGLGTLLHMADCHEKEGKSASAWGEFMLAIEQARATGEKEREKFAKTHATGLAKQLHKLQIDAAERPPGFAIALDGETFALEGLGTALPIDPGEHVVEASAPGKKKWSKTLSLTAAPGLDRIDVPALDDAPAPPSVTSVSAPTSAPITAPTTGASGAAKDEASGMSTKRIAGIGVTGAGVALLGVATYYLLTASSRDNDSNDPAQVASGNAQTLHDQAKTAQTYGFVAGGAGVVALGVGIFLIASGGAPAAPAKAAAGLRIVPILGVTTAGLRGSF